MTSHDQFKHKNLGDYFKLTIKGFCMGVADVIPGISGGTIAFLLGIYEDLIYAIKTVDMRFIARLSRLQFKEAFSGIAWKFLLFLVTGIVTAILVFSKVISWLLEHEAVLVHSFFFGLIAATVPIIARIIRQWTAGKAFAVLAASAGTYYLVGLVPLSTPETWWFVFSSGAVAISAMILPGISGAFILVLIGKYQFLLDAVNQRDFFVLGAFCAGVIAGIVGFVRILSWLFRQYHDLTLAVLTGIVIGSLRKVWPWKEVVRSMTTGHGKVIAVEEVNIVPQALNGELVCAIGVMVIGFVLALKLNGSSGKKLLSS